MKSFKQRYRETLDTIQTPQFNPEKMERADRRYHRALMRQRLTIAASAAVLFLVCTAGVQAAKHYGKSFIFADENGFYTADEKTALNWRETEGIDTANAQDEGADATAFCGDLPGKAAGEAAGESAGEAARESAKVEDYSDTLEKDIPEFSLANGEELESKEYHSLADVQKAGFIIALPDFSLLGDRISREDYYTLDDSYVMVMIETDGRNFYMDQSYYGNSEAHSSNIVYSDGLCNKRNYVSKDGYLFIIADSVAEDGSVTQIHAAISVGDYELIIDMSGYGEEEVFAILDSMDLAVYEP